MPDSNKNKENKSQKKGNKSQNLVLLVHLLLGIWKDHQYIQQGQTGGNPPEQSWSEKHSERMEESAKNRVKII